MALRNISIKTVALIFIFISRIRFASNKSIPLIIRERYGSGTVKLLRQLEKLDFKFRKTEIDLGFLNDCLKLNVIPKFIQFKVSNSNLRSSKVYLECQMKLLKEEVKNKQSRLASLNKDLTKAKKQLRQSMSLIDTFCHLLSLIDFTHVCCVFLSSNTKRINHQLVIQGDKLTRLLSIKDSNTVDPEQIIFNYSDYVLSDVEKSLLSRGLNFSIRPTKLNYADYCCNFEMLYREILTLNSGKDEKLNFIKSRLKDIALTSYYSYNRSPHPPDNLTDEEFSALKSLTLNKDLIIQKADKGNAVVILNRTSYVERMNDILSDQSKFKPIDIKEGKEIRFIEQKEILVKKTLKRLLDERKIPIYTRNKLHPKGSQPGVLYGLSKIHKPLVNGIPKMRPILSAIGTSTYNLAKFLVPLMSNIVSNEFTAKSSFSFSADIHEENTDLYMASLDVDALFTSIPVEETVNICADMLFQNTTSVSNLAKADFKELLTLATSQSWFIFDGHYFDQVDGVAMGSPLGPTLANAFMCFYEKQWLNNCPPEFKPVFYRRYVDDIFVLFKSPEHIKSFKTYLNSCHRSINFTSEEEVNGEFSFLDVKIFREESKFTTSVYRKPTFTGLYTHFNSLLPRSYKAGLILTLLHRCFEICTNFKLFHEEVVYLNAILVKNGYPIKFIQNCIHRFLDKKYVIKPTILTVEPKSLFIAIPFLGYASLQLKQKLSKSLKKTFSTCKVNIIFKTPTRLSNYFKFKDSIPIPLTSHVVYKYKCGSCNTTYYGLCERHCRVRWSDHMSVSCYTGKPIVGVESSIKDHRSSCNSIPIDVSDFEIVAKEQDVFKLKVKESLFIKRDKPALNKNLYSTPLMLF